MRIEHKTKACGYDVYVTEDGQEFSSQHHAKEHEARYIKSTRPMNLEHDFLTDVEDDYHIEVYKINSKEEYDYLRRVICVEYSDYDGYVGPGWYYIKYCDGGDGYDYYDIGNFDKYYKHLKTKLAEYDGFYKIWKDKEPNMRDIDRECMIPIDEFIDMVERGCITDYDGFGHPCNGKHVFDEYVKLNPDWLRKLPVPYICWYNK